MSRESKLAKNTFILAIGTFLPKLATFITLPILTGYLSKEEYGTYDLITVLVSLILPSTTLQIQTAAFRYLIDVRDKKEKVQKIISTIFIFIVPVSLVSLLILYFFLPGDQINVKLMICAYFFADIIVNAARQIVRGLEKNLDYSISAIVSAVGKMVFAAIFVLYFKQGLFGAVIALFGASTISLIVILLRSKVYKLFNPKYFDIECLKEMIAYSWPMIPNSMSMWVMRVSDRFIVTMFMGPAANAIYSVANKIPSLLTLAQNTFTMAWQENASIYSKDSDAGKYYSLMFKTMFDLIAGFFGVLIGLTPILFKLLIKGDYQTAYNQIPILFMAMFFYSMSSFLGGIYVAFKATKSVGVTTVISAILNLGIDIALISSIGLYAASGSTLISYLFLFFFRLIDVQKIIKLEYNVKHMIIIMIPIIIECILCLQQTFIFDIINLVIGFAVFFIFNNGFVNSIFKKIFNLVSSKIK